MEAEKFSNGVAQQLMQTWTEVGNQALKNWFDLVGAASSPTQTAPTSQQIANYQQLQLHLLKLSFDTWQDLFPKVEAGDDWQAALNQYSQKLREQTEALSRTFKTSLDSAELWQIYMQEMQKFSQLWMNALGASIEPLSQTATSSASKPWIELNNLYWNLLYEKTPGNLAHMPLLGPSRDFNHKLIQASEAWAKLYPASLDYQMLLAEIQIKSFEVLMPELVSRAENGETVKDWQQFQQLWGCTVDQVFEQAFCSEENLKVRGKFLNAMNHYKLHQQELMELWMKSLNMPLRSEIDEVHKSIYELRKELKALKKTLSKKTPSNQQKQTYAAVSDDPKL
jgi:class III poly(R)-hydroxyalkanoic acid synthase PhaE subunit